MTSGFRLSPQQAHLLTLRAPMPVIQCVADIRRPIDATVLRGLVQRHEILRTTIVLPVGMRVAQQVIHAALAPAWVVERIGDRASALDDAALDAVLRREAGHELDLDSGPVLRALALEHSDQVRVLILSAPAALVDGASLLIMLGELALLCEPGGDADLAPEPVQYADYAEWRHELVTNPQTADPQGLAFWRDAGLDPPSPPQLPFATPQSGQHVSSERVPLPVDPDLVVAVKRAALASRVTEAVFLEACWHALIARLSGQSELVGAGYCDGRAQAELAGAVGPYAQLVPVATHYEEETSLPEVIDQVRRARDEGSRWHDYASADDLARVGEVAATGFAYVDAAETSAPARAAVELRALSAPIVGPWLQCSFRAADGAIAGELRYDPSVIGSDGAAQLASRFLTLVAGAAADPQQPVEQLPIVGPGERARLVATEPAATAPRTPVHHLFEDRAAGDPDRQAVLSRAASMTYSELDQAANRLAHHLREAGVGPDVPVGLCMERVPDMITALVAILKAGGAYVPLNFEHPPERLRHQLSESGAAVLVTQEHLLERLAPFATTVCTDRDADLIAARPAARPERIGKPDDLAYIIYTSGSTGLPKGVGVTHANLANYTAYMIERLGLAGPGAADGFRAAVISSISTDLGNTSIFPALAAGGALQLFSAVASMDADAFASETREHRPDLLKITPSHLRALLAGRGRDVLPRRWLVLGGEALSWELVELIRSHRPACRIINHYGPTETTIGCCTFDVEGDASRSAAATVPIGGPIANARAYVLDRRLEPVPHGVAGELWIGGAGVARGYVNNPTETAARFGPDPFVNDPAARIYRTGDRVRRWSDATIEFLGRVDAQCKIRGYRVEPGEIEAALTRHPGIRQAAVVAPSDERGDPRLVAYLVASPPPTVAELQAALSRSLPDYMVPAAFVAIESLPLTPSGKVDRQALIGLGSDASTAERDYVAPRDALEQEIAEIWRELLGVERVGVMDDFFALGGHSLLATQAIMRIRRAHGDIPLHALLGAPTVAALADVVRRSNVEVAS
jgi:amino acid adenylation domain-containing protein